MNNTKVQNNKQLPVYRDYDAWEYASGSFSPVTVSVSMEYSLALSINGNRYLTIASSGSDLHELAVGHLFSEGIIASADEVARIDIDTENISVNITTVESERMIEMLLRIRSIPSGCGSQSVIAVTCDGFSIPGIQLRAENIITIMKEFLRFSENHKITRGVHSAALYTTSSERLSFFDEIGRHNAVDKVIGDALLRKIPLQDKILASTGRISGEITAKALNARIPVVVSRSHPTSISIDLARRYDIALIGRVRASSFTVFNGKELFDA